MRGIIVKNFLYNLLWKTNKQKIVIMLSNSIIIFFNSKKIK